MEIEMSFPLEGGCDCKQVRYRMETKPLFVHCCLAAGASARPARRSRSTR